jgi:putative AlgH/UPF0301 family transcriptional regulator
VASFNKKLLVSTPSNTKKGHTRTVILVVADNKKAGTFGLCINRPAPPPEYKKHLSIVPLFLGGPIDTDEKFFFVHDQQDLVQSNEKVVEGVYLSHPRTIDSFTEGKAIMVAGFCKWNPGELENEIKKHWWLIESDPDPSLILASNPRKLWRELTPLHYSMKWSNN